VLRGSPIGGRARRAAAGLLLVAAGCATAGSATREPSPPELEPAAIAAAARRVPEPCRAAVTAALTAGEQLAGGCAAHGQRAAEEALAQGPRRSFGMVERATVRLASVGLVLLHAHHCRRWPLRASGEPALYVGAARAAGCGVRRYVGPLTVSVATADGAATRVMTVHTDGDGQVEVNFMEVDALLRARGYEGLYSFAELQVGAGGWAARVALPELRAQLAEWHAAWVGRGRGSPGLFVALHPESAAAATMRTRALEATLKRQAEDAAAVERGELPARRFLERHMWSPYRSLVEQVSQGAAP
jgi:hypothetical protein